MKRTKSKKSAFAAVISAILIFLGVLCFFSAVWYINVYGKVGFDAILYTLFSNIGGAETSLVYGYLLYAALPAVIVTATLSAIILFNWKRRIFATVPSGRKIRVFPLPRAAAVTVSLLLSLVLIVFAAGEVDLFDYIKHSAVRSSTFIEDNYVSPEKVKITFPEKKQNLIFIYLESMETSFLSADYHGGNDVNPMSELCALAQENLNFSHNETVGGFYSPGGTEWTVGAMVAMNAGIPLKLPIGIDANNYGVDSFLPGTATISDILHENGYYQAFMCGSESAFGGRKQFFECHKTDDVFDLNTAKEDGIVPEDYKVWWGMEDLHLFEYAKLKLTEISKGDKPFAFSMLTVDTHHVGGYVCSKCENKFPTQYENVLACSSRQTYEFVNWIKKQSFYENTTIILCGDHPTMDGDFVANNLPEDYERRVYNCFINARATTGNSKNRVFTSIDMFPTILAAIGCQIKGDRLGLGVNLFSDTPTLSESMTAEKFKEELSAKSNFYDYKLLRRTS